MITQTAQAATLSASRLMADLAFLFEHMDVLPEGLAKSDARDSLHRFSEIWSRFQLIISGLRSYELEAAKTLDENTNRALLREAESKLANAAYRYDRDEVEAGRGTIVVLSDIPGPKTQRLDLLAHSALPDAGDEMDEA